MRQPMQDPREFALATATAVAAVGSMFDNLDVDPALFFADCEPTHVLYMLAFFTAGLLHRVPDESEARRVMREWGATGAEGYLYGESGV